MRLYRKDNAGPAVNIKECHKGEGAHDDEAYNVPQAVCQTCLAHPLCPATIGPGRELQTRVRHLITDLLDIQYSNGLLFVTTHTERSVGKVRDSIYSAPY